MDFWFIAYILISIVLGLGAVSYTYKRGQSIAAMLILVLLIGVFVFYGLRWFSGGSLKGTTGTNIPWPPIVNVCPDFMTSTQPSGGKIYCYDKNDLYGLKGVTGSPRYANEATDVTINSVAYGGIVIVDGSKGTADRTLSMDLNNANTERRYPFLSAMKANLPGVIADKAAIKDLRWEGVYDGVSATPDKAPLPKPV